MTKNNPLFSIIVVSFNTKDITINCLNSIYQHTKGIPFEIVLVENGSTDGSVMALKKYAKSKANIRFIDLKKNLGFGLGNNAGADVATGEYLVLLNSDTLFTYNILKNIAQKITKLKNLGVYSCKLLNSDLTTQGSGGYFPTLFNVFAWQFFIDDLPFVGKKIKSFHPQIKSYNDKTKLEWVTGAFVVIPRVLFDRAGGFDKNIFMYTEEMELMYRISQMGYASYYDNSNSLIHLGGSSGGSFLALTSEIRYMIYFFKKHKPKWQLPFVKLIFFVGSLLRLLIFGIIKQDAKARRAYLHALGLCF